MAIDDNTLYGLTGAQVKELPGKIEAVKGKAKVLTADDYNYPTDNPTQVATWLLENGLYYAPTGVSVIPAVTSAAQTDIGFIVSGSTSWKTTVTFGPQPWLTTANQYGAVQFSSVVLRQADVVNNLTTSSSVQPLSANQGKVLNDKIGGDLSNLTTTNKTSLINAINEVAGQGGGGFTELTTEDYDWPTANPTHVALWNLPDGMYWLGSGVNGVATTSSISDGRYINGGLAIAFVWSSTAGYKSYVVFQNNTAMLYKVTNTGTIGSALYPISLITNVVQTTGTNTKDVMSQKAVTDAIAAIPTGGVTELTSADYNWPTSNPTSVALWLLDNGMYVAESDSVNVSIAYNKTGLGNGIALVKQLDNENPSRANIVVLKDDSSAIYYGMTADGRNASQYNLRNPTVVQTTGTSTADVMSQNAVTSMVYADPSNMTKVRIGGGTVSSLTNYCVAIGLNASVNGEYGISIGPQASAVWQGSIALGAFSGGAGNLTSPGMIHVGSSNTDHGYNNSNYRLLTGLYDGQSDHDAVTVGQVNSVIDNLNSALNINIPHIGA